MLHLDKLRQPKFTKYLYRTNHNRVNLGEIDNLIRERTSGAPSKSKRGMDIGVREHFSLGGQRIFCPKYVILPERLSKRSATISWRGAYRKF